jgi:hypothetical protein
MTILTLCGEIQNPQGFDLKTGKVFAPCGISVILGSFVPHLL